MGVFRPVVERFQGNGRKSTVEPSDRIITPATIMSASRPELARRARNRLINGQKGAAYITAACFATDMEGSVARLIDKLFPGKGWGVSKFGIPADTIADSAALMIIGEGIIKGPKVHPLGKLATGMVLGQESFKAGWAGLRTVQFKAATGQRLEIPVQIEGKEAMVEKMFGIELAVITNELDSPAARLAIGSAALTVATAGSVRGEAIRRAYDRAYPIMLEEGILDAKAA